MARLPFGGLALANSTLYRRDQRGSSGRTTAPCSRSAATGTGFQVFSLSLPAQMTGLTLFGPDPHRFDLVLAQTNGGHRPIKSVPCSPSMPIARISDPVTPSPEWNNGSAPILYSQPLTAIGSTLYGTTNNGGTANDGTIFSISSTGQASNCCTHSPRRPATAPFPTPE